MPGLDQLQLWLWLRDCYRACIPQQSGCRRATPTALKEDADL
jgi:hypothetical protein